MPVLLATLTGALVFFVVQALLGMVLASALPASPPGTALWGFVSNVVLAGTIAVLARQARLHGPRLAATLFLVVLFTTHVANLVEAVVFRMIAPSILGALIPMELVPLAAAIPLMLLVAGVWR